jgi:hypothetical protein
MRRTDKKIHTGKGEGDVGDVELANGVGLSRRACSLVRNFLLTGFDRIIGDAGDARLDIFLRENLHQFLRGQAEFLSPPMFFPIPGTLGYSDAYLLDGLIYVPLRIIGLDPFLSFEILCIAISLVGFASANVLLMRFGGVRQPLAALAAAIFVFSNGLYIAMGHPQLYECQFCSVSRGFDSGVCTLENYPPDSGGGGWLARWIVFGTPFFNRFLRRLVLHLLVGDSAGHSRCRGLTGRQCFALAGS